MKVAEILAECFSDLSVCEVVYVDQQTGEEISLQESFTRRFKRTGSKIKKMFRCSSGPKKGMTVSDPRKCNKRKDPRKVRSGRKTMRTKGATIHRKAKIGLRTAPSRLLRRLNRSL